MILTEEFLRSFNFCNKGLDYWKKSGEKDLCDFMSKCLDDDHWDWAIWVLIKSVKTDILVDLAVFSAQSVAHIFNERYQNDKSVSKCIDAIKKFRKGKILLKTLRKHAAASYAAASAAADYAAASSSSYNAAYYTVYAAVAAAYAASYAADYADAAAYSAAYAASYSADAASYYAEDDAADAKKEKRKEFINYLKKRI